MRPRKGRRGVGQRHLFPDGGRSRASASIDQVRWAVLRQRYRSPMPMPLFNWGCSGAWRGAGIHSQDGLASLAAGLIRHRLGHLTVAIPPPLSLLLAGLGPALQWAGGAAHNAGATGGEFTVVIIPLSKNSTVVRPARAAAVRLLPRWVGRGAKIAMPYKNPRRDTVMFASGIRIRQRVRGAGKVICHHPAGHKTGSCMNTANVAGNGDGDAAFA